MNSRIQRSAISMALIAMTTALSTANAEVSHRFVQIPIEYWTVVDVDENGVVDYEGDPHSHGSSVALSGVTWQNGFLSEFSANGDLVGPVRSGGDLYYSSVLVVFSWGWYWSYSMPIGKHLVGIEFLRDGVVYYGWLGIDVVPGYGQPVFATITEIAWESEPEVPILAGWGDCNGNGLNDVVEILSGGNLPDCNGDLIDDDCQPDTDCNGNGVRDLCELGMGGAWDCNGNLVPDACEIAADPSLDCNNDGVLDSCLGALADCDGDGVNDQCQLIPGSEDCNGNGLFDWCEINYDPTLDCNGNGVLDACDIAADPSLDCDGDGVIDACLSSFVDCDGDGIPDACAIAAGLVEDCDGNGVPDSCEGTPFVGDPSCLFLSGGGASAVIAGFGDTMPSSQVTIEIWQWIQAPGPHPTFWTDGDGDNACNVYHLDGKVIWEFGNEFGNQFALSYTPPAPIVGSWQHFAFQASAGEFMRIYRNGVLEAEKSGADTFSPMGQSLIVGGAFWDHSAGRIDELRIWNYVRSAEQIQQFMSGPVDPATPGLVGYWRFDEGSGTVSKDLAGSHDASLNDLAYWSAELRCRSSADINADGFVNSMDLAILLGAWGRVSSGSSADLNHDAVVDAADLAMLLTQWG